MNEKLQKFIAENASLDTSGKWMSIDNVEKLVQLTVLCCADELPLTADNYEVYNQILSRFGIDRE